MGSRGPKPGTAELPVRGEAGRDRRERFLATLRETGSLIESARRASPHTEKGALTSFRNLIRDSAEFAAKVGEALDSFRDSLVQAAIKRGRDGVDRPVYQRGELVGFERQYSDNLLLAELRRHFPQHYSERHQHDHTHVVINPAGAWTIDSADIALIKGHPDSARLLANLKEIMVTVRDGRRTMAALPAPDDVTDAEFEDVTDYADFDLGEEGLADA